MSQELKLQEAHLELQEARAKARSLAKENAELQNCLEEAEGPLSDALCAAFARVTREPLSFTRQEWLIWWNGRKSRPSTASPSGETASGEGSDH